MTIPSEISIQHTITTTPYATDEGALCCTCVWTADQSAINVPEMFKSLRFRVRADRKSVHLIEYATMSGRDHFKMRHLLYCLEALSLSTITCVTWYDLDSCNLKSSVIKRLDQGVWTYTHIRGDGRDVKLTTHTKLIGAAIWKQFGVDPEVDFITSVTNASDAL